MTAPTSIKIPAASSSHLTSSSSSANGSSTTDGLYGTTPGGSTSRIFYSRDQLLNLASSPLSKSPPKMFLESIPDLIARNPGFGLASPTLSESSTESNGEESEKHFAAAPTATPSANVGDAGDDEHFSMEL